jgi:hypothetical protein
VLLVLAKARGAMTRSTIAERCFIKHGSTLPRVLRPLIGLGLAQEERIVSDAGPLRLVSATPRGREYARERLKND